jgi:hypothetical protein
MVEAEILYEDALEEIARKFNDSEDIEVLGRRNNMELGGEEIYHVRVKVKNNSTRVKDKIENALVNSDFANSQFSIRPSGSTGYYVHIGENVGRRL